MIRRIGLDLVELERIELLLARHGDRFLARICRDGEVLDRIGEARIQHVGGLFAAKEAVLKVLGTGWARGLAFRQVEIHRDEAGAPSVALHGAAITRARELGIDTIHLSITHERRTAAAVAIGEGTDRR